jgi:hypothetical protein
VKKIHGHHENSEESQLPHSIDVPDMIIHDNATQQIEDETKFPENADTSELKENLFNFLTELHANSSMTKKLIQTIYDSVKKYVLLPILSTLLASDEERQRITKAYETFNSFHKYKKCLKLNRGLQCGKHFN